MMQRNLSIDFAKGILITLVVIGHSIQFVSYRGSDLFFSDLLFKFIYMFHMPLFMAIAGYLSYTSIRKFCNWRLVISRVKSYILPIVTWGSLYTMLYIILHENKVADIFDFYVTHIFSGQLWFLWVLLGCILVSVGVNLMSRFFWSVYAISTVLVLFLPESGNWVFLKFMYPFFQIGFVVAHFNTRICWERYLRVLLPVSVLVTAISFMLWSSDSYIYNGGMILVSGNRWNVLLRLFGGVFSSLMMITVIIQVYFLCQRSLFVRWLEDVGRDSIYVYILQAYAFTIFCRTTWEFKCFSAEEVPSAVTGIAFGGILTLLFWVIGNILCRSPILAQILFGKKPRT